MKKAHPEAKVEFMELDLCSFESGAAPSSPWRAASEGATDTESRTAASEELYTPRAWPRAHAARIRSAS